MPELPEVETTMRGLEPVMLRRKILHIDLRREGLRAAFTPGFKTQLEGRMVVGLQRRGKYILGFTDDGSGFGLHLGMSGRLLIIPPRQDFKPARHDHVIFEMEDGGRVAFNDARRFGMLFLIQRDAWQMHESFAGMGPEPLERAFTGKVLLQHAAGRKTPIKVALLDQRIVAGVGNIYASEALYHARIHPARAAGKITLREANALVVCLKKVLRDAIKAGGSSLKDFRHADGNLGYFQHSFSVYDREGDVCPECRRAGRKGGCIQKITQAGRSTFYCPKVQRR